LAIIQRGNSEIGRRLLAARVTAPSNDRHGPGSRCALLDHAGKLCRATPRHAAIDRREIPIADLRFHKARQPHRIHRHGVSHSHDGMPSSASAVRAAPRIPRDMAVTRKPLNLSQTRRRPRTLSRRGSKSASAIATISCFSTSTLSREGPFRVIFTYRRTLDSPAFSSRIISVVPYSS
jgi:hypothetical protein